MPIISPWFIPVLAPALGLEIPFLAGLFDIGRMVLLPLPSLVYVKDVFTPIMLLIACVASLLIFIQVGVHDESISDPDLRSFITWIMGLMIVQSLLLRPGIFPPFSNRLVHYRCRTAALSRCQ